MPGKTMMLTAKISGIMPAELTFSGMWVVLPPYMPVPSARAWHDDRNPPLSLVDEHDPDDGDQPNASRTGRVPMMLSAERAAGRPASRPCPADDATMPPKMMIETPLPMPFSVINSPIQTRNIVPAVIESRMARSSSAGVAVEETEVLDQRPCRPSSTGCEKSSACP